MNILNALPFVPLLNEMDEESKKRIIRKWNNARARTQAFYLPIGMIFGQALQKMSEHTDDPLLALKGQMIPKSERMKDFDGLDYLEALWTFVSEIPKSLKILMPFIEDKEESKLLRLELTALLRFRAYYYVEYLRISGKIPEVVFYPGIDSDHMPQEESIVHKELLPICLHIIRILEQTRNNTWLQFFDLGPLDYKNRGISKVSDIQLSSVELKINFFMEKKEDFYLYVIGIMAKEPNSPWAILERTKITQTLPKLQVPNYQTKVGDSLLIVLRLMAGDVFYQNRKKFFMKFVESIGELHQNNSMVTAWNDERTKRIELELEVLFGTAKRVIDLIQIR